MSIFSVDFDRSEIMYLTKKDFTIDINQQSMEVPDGNGARQSTIMSPGKCVEYVYKDAKTVAEALRRGHKVSNDGPCVGWRESREYKWLKYSEVIERSQYISYGLVHAGLKKGQEFYVGIYSQNCVEWVLVEHACFCQSAVTVPLYSTLGPNACTYILNHVEAEFLFCDTEDKARSILDVKEEIPKLRYIFLIKEVGPELKNLAKKKGVTINCLKDLEESGRREPDSLKFPSPSDSATVCYTSGTTGIPKGVMLTHCNIISEVSGTILHMGLDLFDSTDRYLSFLPMAHMLDRISQIIMYISGGSVGFFSGDVKLLLDDFCCLKPTLVVAVPRIFNKIYDKVQNKVQSSFFKKTLLDMALRAKQAEIDKGIIRNNSAWDRFVLKKVRKALGGKVRAIVSGGAPIRPEVATFLRSSFGCLIYEAYGQTECTAACSFTVKGECRPGSVGPPLPCSFVKVMDVPEMNYYAKNGEGEVLVKGPIVTKGYFKDPERTAEILDKDGWLHTGDIGRWDERGALFIVDRKKSILKLSQGEYVSPEMVEGVYMTSPYVEQIFVHGESVQNYLVAIVVPSKDALLPWCSQHHIKGEWQEMCENEIVKDFIFKEMSRIADKSHLKGFEKVKAIHLHPDIFTQENGLLTATMKLKRMDCRKQFKKEIQKMYDNLQ